MSRVQTHSQRHRWLVSAAGCAALLSMAVMTGCGQVAASEPRAVPTAPASTPAAAPTTASSPSASTSSEPQASESTNQPSSPASKESSRPAPKPSANTSTVPAGPALLAPGDTGQKVRDLQDRLRQVGWFDDQITGNYGPVTETAVKAFQRKRGLPATGKLDRATLDKLTAMSKTPMTNQKKSDDKKKDEKTAGPALYQKGAKGDKVTELQARLAQAGWFADQVTGNYGPVTETAVKGFQARRGIPATGKVDQNTWDRLVKMTRKPSAQELSNQPKKTTTTAGSLDPRCLTGRVICISKGQRKVVWVVDGKAVVRFDARFGRVGMETREGTFSVGWKSRNHTSTIYNTWMPYAMFFSGGQAVHYSPDFAKNGYNGASHGCVNIRDKAGVAWLFDQVREGDKVVVY